MPRRPRMLTEHDRVSWADYARTLRPLPGRVVPAPPPPASPEGAAAAPPPRPPAPKPARRAPSLLLTTGEAPAGLDRASWKRFSDGRLPPAKTLDLHGKTAQAAYHALERFLHTAQAEHLRCVEVVTGRGQGEQGGILRRELPLWLNLPHIRPLVLAATHPGGRAANTGATRILLRKVK